LLTTSVRRSLPVDEDALGAARGIHEHGAVRRALGAQGPEPRSTPMNSATNSLAGAAMISSGVPTWAMRAPFSG
jgi:hypothetical protein